MAVLKYRGSDGAIKTLGINSSGGTVVSGVSSVNGKTGVVTGLYDSNNPPPYPVSSVNGKTGAVRVETGSVIRTATLTFDFSDEDMAHICRTSLVSSVDRVINIIPTINGVFNGGINYSGGYLIAGFLSVGGDLYTGQLACRVIYYA